MNKSIYCVELSREDIKNIYQIMNDYKEISSFKIQQDYTSGIGHSTVVRFDNDAEKFPIITEIDITDYSEC